ncbi:MAG TPA: M28 family peptidase [Hyphomicrobiales bacterium]|nr:M28 family peptidase [Hyphomicrobiales bacterium]
MADIAAQLRYAPRSIGTPGHEQTFAYIKAELAKTSAKAVKTQSWSYEAPARNTIELTNLIASFNPENPRRIIVATHYDSIVRAYRDAEKPNDPMPGANNSASGVAVLLETARALSALPPAPFGVDFIFFDGEEGPHALGEGDPQWAPIGSRYFAAHLSDIYPDRKPEKAVDFDMVCYKNLRLNPDMSSLLYAGAEVRKFWGIGKSISPEVFELDRIEAPIGDDHTALAGAGIPSFVVIDFKYEPWYNTTKDTIDKCSAKSLEAVGRTLLRYLYTP